MNIVRSSTPVVESTRRKVFLVFIGVLVVTCLLANLPHSSATSTDAADELVGLWKAHRWFGPVARGPLVIKKAGVTYTADMCGRILPVRVEKGELSFELPNGQGAFRGKLEAGGEILGHWFPPPSTAQFVGFKYASPVRLKQDGANLWSGQVVPFDDVFTFYLMAQKRPDGSLSVILRNPDRDFGGQIGAERMTREGNVIKLFGKRAGQTQERELASGTYNPDSEVLTLSFPFRGGSYDFKRDDDDSDFYPRGKNPGRYVYSPPLARDDDWPTGTLEEAGINRAWIEKFIQMIIERPMDSLSTPQVHGILIARHGKLVLEEYFHGQHRDKLHETRSASKSLTATLIGAAMQSGAPLKLSTPVYQIMNGGEFPPNLEPQKRAMTLEHLLTTSSGYFCDDTNPDAPGNENTMLDESKEPDYYRFTLNLPMASQPGEKSVYCSINPNLALGMMSRATGESPLYTFDRLLGGPMKIHRYGWSGDPAGNPYGGGGVQFLPRDFMKLGQLMLNGGTWQGRRILSRDFVARASAPLYHLRNVYYGYLWWGIDYPYKERTVHGFYAGGSGGQGVMVIPELDLVIATYGGNYSSGRSAIHIQQELIPRYILPAVREKGDDDSAPVKEREYVTPYGRSSVSGPVASKPVQKK
jgi:CubicO group peptidase (beta-lactamase class C family)